MSSKSSKGEGNNKPLRKLQISNCISWCFTFNNYNDEIIQEFQNIMKNKCRLGFFNKEVGESGTPHLQGYIEFIKKNRPKDLFPKGAHWSKAKGNKDQNFKYCSKDSIDENMTFSFGYKIKPKIKVISELRPFQKDIEDLLLGPVNEGKIIWIYDIIGQLGKTELLRYLFSKYEMPFSYGGKASDIINLVFNNKEYLLENDKAVMIYNFGRDTNNERISYKSMEQISDGCISNTKFETGCFICNKPHVLVLANCLPKINGVTTSRWMIKTINPKTFKLEEYVEEMNPLDEMNL